MRGFLSNWINRKSEQIALTRNQRAKPTLSAKTEPPELHLSEDISTAESHPDTMFLDYEEWVTKTPATLSNESTESLQGNLNSPHHPSNFDKDIDQAVQSDGNPPTENLEVLELAPQDCNTDNFEIYTTENINDLNKKSLASCGKCGKSFADFDAAVKLLFCPFCGAEQTNYEATTENVDSQSDYTSEDAGFSENITDDYQAKPLEDAFVEEETYAFLTEFHATEQRLKENKQKINFKLVPNIFSENSLDRVDKGFGNNILENDLKIYQLISPIQKSSVRQHEPSINSIEFSFGNQKMEDWEIFLDEDLEEQSYPYDQYFEDEDPLERGKIVEYASRLASRITYHQSKDQRKIYASFVNILGDFPFYQSYAAIERLISKGSQIEDILDAYAVKLLWMTNPNIWSSRRYSRIENNWSVFRNPKLKNSMSWQLASDLVRFYTPNELENLILNDWYAEWLNLPLQGGDTVSGIDPSYSLYPTYLYEKRSLITSYVNNW